MQDLTNRTVMKKYLLLFLVGLGGACTSPDFSKQYSENEKNRIDSIVYAGRNIDTLRVMVDRFAAEENLYGQVKNSNVRKFNFLNIYHFFKECD